MIHDDVLATGGTVEAIAGLVEQLGGHVVGVNFVIELSFLNGRERLARHDLFSLIEYYDALARRCQRSSQLSCVSAETIARRTSRPSFARPRRCTRSGSSPRVSSTVVALPRQRSLLADDVLGACVGALAEAHLPAVDRRCGVPAEHDGVARRVRRTSMLPVIVGCARNAAGRGRAGAGRPPAAEWEGRRTRAGALDGQDPFQLLGAERLQPPPALRIRGGERLLVQDPAPQRCRRGPSSRSRSEILVIGRLHAHSIAETRGLCLPSEMPITTLHMYDALTSRYTFACPLLGREPRCAVGLPQHRAARGDRASRRLPRPLRLHLRRRARRPRPPRRARLGAARARGGDLPEPHDLAHRAGGERAEPGRGVADQGGGVAVDVLLLPGGPAAARCSRPSSSC